MIGANSFVNEDVPPYAIVVGSPAKVLRYRFDPQTIKSLLASKWWDLLPEEMSDVNFAQIDQALDQIKKIHAEKLRLKKQPKKKPAKNKEPAKEPSSNAAEKLNKILDSALSEKAQKKSKQLEQPENSLLVEHLERFFLELDVPADIAKVVHQRIFSGVLASLDLLNPNDQEILRNKMEFLSGLIRSRDTSAITSSETKKIEQIFGQIR